MSAQGAIARIEQGARRERAQKRAALRRLADIYVELDEATARRTELWRALAHEPDPRTAAKANTLSRLIASLWSEAREAQACLRQGSRERILARARREGTVPTPEPRRR